MRSPTASSESVSAGTKPVASAAWGYQAIRSISGFGQRVELPRSHLIAEIKSGESDGRLNLARFENAFWVQRIYDYGEATGHFEFTNVPKGGALIFVDGDFTAVPDWTVEKESRGEYLGRDLSRYGGTMIELKLDVWLLDLGSLRITQPSTGETLDARIISGGNLGSGVPFYGVVSDCDSGRCVVVGDPLAVCRQTHTTPDSPRWIVPKGC